MNGRMVALVCTVLVTMSSLASGDHPDPAPDAGDCPACEVVNSAIDAARNLVDKSEATRFRCCAPAGHWTVWDAWWWVTLLLAVAMVFALASGHCLIQRPSSRACVPMLTGYVGFLIAFFILGSAEGLRVETDWFREKPDGISPVHGVAASYLALLASELAVLGFCGYAICRVSRGSLELGFWVLVWLALSAASLVTYYLFRLGFGDAVHPVYAVRPVAKALMCSDFCQKAAWGLQILEITTFAAIAALVTTASRLVHLVLQSSQDRWVSRDSIAFGIQWLRYTIAAGGLMLAVSAWNQSTWMALPIRHLRPCHRGAYEEAAQSLVAYHATMHVVILLLVACPALLMVQRHAGKFASRWHHAQGHRERNQWMERNGLSFSRADWVASTFAALLPVVVAGLLTLI